MVKMRTVKVMRTVMKMRTTTMRRRERKRRRRRILLAANRTTKATLFLKTVTAFERSMEMPQKGRAYVGLVSKTTRRVQILVSAIMKFLTGRFLTKRR